MLKSSQLLAEVGSKRSERATGESFGDPECGAMLDAALALAAKGMAVFPLKYLTKEPATRCGFYDASTNPATIERWFGGNFKRNLAVRTGLASGVWVLDVDDAGSLEALEARYGRLQTTLQSQSSRGIHFWFKTPTSPLRNSAGRVGPGIDVRAESGLVAVPPSVHPDGVVYRWTNDAPIVHAPQWLEALASKPSPPRSASPRTFSGTPGAYGAAALRAEVEILALTPQGGRNHALNRGSFVLHQLVAGGELDAGEVERNLVDAAVKNGLVNDDGIRSVMATIRRGARAGMLHPRSRPGAAHDDAGQDLPADLHCFAEGRFTTAIVRCLPG